MYGRLSPTRSASQVVIDKPTSEIRKIMLVDGWGDGPVAMGFCARLEETPWRVVRVCEPVSDVVDLVLEEKPQIVLLTTDNIDASTIALTDAISAKAQVPVAWLVRDPTVTPWCSSPLWVLGASECADVLAERLERIAVPPSLPELESSGMLQATLDAVPFGMVVACPNHGLVSVNKAMRDLFGLTEEELRNGGLAGITHSEDNLGQLRKLRDLFAGAVTSIDLEARYLTKDGTIVWGRTAIGLSLAGPEQRPLFIVSMQDWEQQRESRLSLLQSESRFRRATSAMPIVFWALTPDWRTVVYISPSFERVYGYSSDALIEDPGLWLKAIHPNDRERVIRHVTKHHGEPGTVEYRIVRSDGEVRWLRDVMAPVYDSGGRLELVTGFGQDVTGNTSGELVRLCMEENARQAETLESLGQTAFGFAHDFNNMLLGMRGYAELALRRVGDDEVAAGHVQRVVEATRRASELCDSLIAHTSCATLRKQPVDMAAVVDEVVKMMSEAVHAETTVRFDALTDVSLIQADATQIRQLTMNLILNASDALGGRAGVVHVSVSEGVFDAEELRTCAYAEASGSMRGVLLRVADTGEGIAPEALGRIFEPFFSTKGEGRGLGLASARGIVRRHGGALRVQSKVGKGTVFHVLFPAN